MSTYLKSLEISGFKSFGNRTLIEFSDGITGIVGPNGCGKSNVIESMKWVLGEQSARSLRGEKMQDIIFAGTKHRSAAGMADVSVTFNNEKQWLPLEFPEISIGRRIFRSGEGQYFVNGVRSRLKDTTELFLDTGVGRDSYAIFEQGKIDRLLSESAEDRRILFEDFAGISKFKFRKEEAEKKLALARENLDRLQETIDRLEKEIASLEIQASDAENYNIINAELREMELKFEIARVENMKREITRREKDIQNIQESLTPLTEELDKIEEQMMLNDEGLAEKEVLFGKMNEKYITLEKELTEAKTSYNMAKKNYDDTKVRLHELEIRSKQDQERLEEWEEEIVEKREALLEAEKKQKEAQHILENAELLQQELREKNNALDEDLLKTSQEIGYQKAISRSDGDSLRSRIGELKGQIFLYETDIIKLEEEIQAKKKDFQDEKQILATLENSYNKAKDIQDQLTQKKQLLNENINSIEQEIIFLEQEQKNYLDASKNCDQIILAAMDQQISDIKNFQQIKASLSERLKKILTLLKDISAAGNILSIAMYEELYQAISANNQEYDDLIGKLFGEGGAFADKIAIAEKMEQTASQIREKRQYLETQRKEFSSINEQENEAIRQTSIEEGNFKSSEKELQKISKSMVHNEERFKALQNNFEQSKIEQQTKELKLEQIDSAIKDYEGKLSELRIKSADFQDEFTNARINYNSMETQTRGLQKDIKSLEDRIEDLLRTAKNSNNDKASLKKTITTLEEEMEDFLSEQDEMAPELSRIQDAMRKNSEEITELRNAKKSLELIQKDYSEKFNKLRMRESEIEGSLIERRETLENMKRNLNEQYKIEEKNILLEEHESTEYLNSKIRSHREKLNQLGNVNLLAIEQFQNSKEQYTHLITQKEDIEAAASDTESLINDTNKESAERFLTAFEKVRKTFRTLFSELFDGGRADLILKDKMDPLRSGIDIMAEPPGQKFQNVSLLSGGQRAMVAIAVIFSILELKPTPFVILDEMDAPLDDENIDRFKRLLVRFRGTSQFVVVSHSKSTLEVCDVLFGVTMEEQGCSKVVSVAFDDTENLLFTQ